MKSLRGGNAGEQFVESKTISIGPVFGRKDALLLPYAYLPTLISIGLLCKWWLGDKLPAIRWLLVWCLGEYLGVFGIAVAQHRYFTHQAFQTNWLGKQILGISGLLTLQGQILHWAFMHRIHHRLCDQELDFHSPIASERGFWFAHAMWMTTPHPHYKESAEMRTIVTDLSSDPDITWMDAYPPEKVFFAVVKAFALVTTLFTLIGVAREHKRNRGATSLCKDTLIPALLRLPASIWFYVAIYYALPVLISWHGTMMINSVTHWWGEMPHEDAMSAACEARNVPGLQWVLMGENWHNNHHAAPTSASTWVEWYQVDGVYILIRCLELVGLAHNVKVEVPMKREGFVYSGWEFPIQISTQLLFFWLWWHFYLRHYYFTGGAGNASGVEMAAAKGGGIDTKSLNTVKQEEDEPLTQSDEPPEARLSSVPAW